MHSFYPLSQSILCFKGIIIKLVKATLTVEKLKQRSDITRVELGTSRTEGHALTNCATLSPIGT